MEKEKTQIVIIGAGIVGLAIGYSLSRKNQEIVILEKEGSFGQATSSRNSEIIHTGIYYPKNSLKAKLCVEGKEQLYAFCSKEGVPFNKIGKLILANDNSEIGQLEELFSKGNSNGVEDLKIINRTEIDAMEGDKVGGKAALFSPSTCIVDTHKLMKKLEQKINEKKGIVNYGGKVVGIKKYPMDTMLN
jgi:L-2-hydroxyglutarate oxidase LhgO